MKILFLVSTEEDYLADGLLLGLRALTDLTVIDYPRADLLYRDCPKAVRAQVRGAGFTLYTGLLEPSEKDRFHIRPRLENGEFDLVVVSDIWRQYGYFVQWRSYLNRRNTIILDGADTPQVYPYAGRWWRRPYNWFQPRAHREFLYFKREWTPGSQFNLWHRLLPRRWWTFLPSARNLRQTAFSIPEEKITSSLSVKTKDFPQHIVDPEVAVRVPGSATSHAFATEQEYYADLQASRFGITTKRAGWDCLRHYEIAANGTVPCFRDLDRKPATCAPHGLVPGVNCLSYRSVGDLLVQVGAMAAGHYDALRTGALAWARANTCRQRANEIIRIWRKDYPAEIGP